MKTLDLLPDQIPAGWNKSSAAYDRDMAVIQDMPRVRLILP